MSKKIVVVGGGVAGLSAAHRVKELAEQRGVDVDLVLFEAGPRAGGVISTVKTDGYLVEMGPDMFITNKPWALDLTKRLGLESELISTNDENRRAFVLLNGELVAVPEGFLMLAPSKIKPFLSTPLFSWATKLRMLCDLFIPSSVKRDESLASFVRRRLGREALERGAEPLISGVYTADAEKLSLRATMPQFVEMEEQFGSLILAMLNKNSKSSEDSGARYSMFMSFRDGMQTLIDSLVESLPKDTLHLKTPVDKIYRHKTGWKLKTGRKLTIADGVIITAPSHATSEMLTEVDANLSSSIASIPHASSAVAVLGYRATDIGDKLDGFGFVVPRIEGRDIIACSYSSVKFDGRTPEGTQLLRVFMGGATNEQILDKSDYELIDIATREIEPILKIKAKPQLKLLARYPNAMPQYHVGHIDKVNAIMSLLDGHKGLAVGGLAYRGVGIPDSVHSGEIAAEKVVTDLF